MYLLGNTQPHTYAATNTQRLTPQTATCFYNSTALKPAELPLPGAVEENEKKESLGAFTVSKGSP